MQGRPLRRKGDLDRWSGMSQCAPSDRTFAAAAPIAVIDTGAFNGNHLESDAFSVDKGQRSCESEDKNLQRYPFRPLKKQVVYNLEHLMRGSHV